RKSATKYIIPLLMIISHLSFASSDLPVGSAPAALNSLHFPSALHAVVWRNWELIPREQIAETVKATPEQVSALAESMGLPPQRAISPDIKERGYISIIRRN